MSGHEVLPRHPAPRFKGFGACPPAPPTVFEWAGGQPAIERRPEAFYVHVLRDELLAPLSAGMPAEHAHHVAVWLGEVLGGPAAYTEGPGGYPHGAAVGVGKAPAYAG